MHCLKLIPFRKIMSIFVTLDEQSKDREEYHIRMGFRLHLPIVRLQCPM